MPRRDLTPEQVAREWLGGASFAALAERHGVSVSTIQARLKKARTEHPDLPWDARPTIRPVPMASPTEDYISMTDGHAGDGTLTYGSIVPSRTVRKRG